MLTVCGQDMSQFFRFMNQLCHESSLLIQSRLLFCSLCPYTGAAIQILKYPAGFSQGLDLGRTWHQSSRKRSPETRHARIRERKSRAATKGVTGGSGGAAPRDTEPHKYTLTPEDTWGHTKHAGLLHSRPFNRLSYSRIRSTATALN